MRFLTRGLNKLLVKPVDKTRLSSIDARKRKQLTRKLVNALLCGGFLICQGCGTVAPWERGNLAKKEMSINPHPNLNSFRDHIFSSKEASQGGHSGAGGGCGCN